MKILNAFQKWLAEERLRQAQRERDNEAQRQRQRVFHYHHETLQTATGLRFTILEMHRPVWQQFPAGGLVCHNCWDGNTGRPFPCETYKIARDWGSE
jgi:hypothetical protein